jgi:hypothetical protein
MIDTHFSNTLFALSLCLPFKALVYNITFSLDVITTLTFFHEQVKTNKRVKLEEREIMHKKTSSIFFAFKIFAHHSHIHTGMGVTGSLLFSIENEIVIKCHDNGMKLLRVISLYYCELK